jgi:hypothetical protein
MSPDEFPLGEAEVAMLLALGAMAVVGLLLMLIPAYQAYHRGYNPVVWGLAGFFSSNPLFVLIVLAMVPHRARRRLRERYREELDAKLAAVGAGPAGEPTRAARADTFTVGDAATRLPDRSIGDDLTRM